MKDFVVEFKRAWSKDVESTVVTNYGKTWVKDKFERENPQSSIISINEKKENDDKKRF